MTERKRSSMRILPRQELGSPRLRPRLPRPPGGEALVITDTRKRYRAARLIKTNSTRRDSSGADDAYAMRAGVHYG